MSNYRTLSYKIAARIQRRKALVFVREDFVDLGGYDQAGRTTQVPIGRLIAVKGRINRKISYGGAHVHFEPAT